MSRAQLTNEQRQAVFGEGKGHSGLRFPARSP